MTSQPVYFGRLPFQLVSRGWARELLHSELLVYVVLAAHVNGTGWEVCLSHSELAAATGLSRRTIQRCLARLQDRGLILITASQGKAGAYALQSNLPYLPPAPGSSPAPGGVGSVRSAGSASGNDSGGIPGQAQRGSIL